MKYANRVLTVGTFADECRLGYHGAYAALQRLGLHSDYQREIVEKEYEFAAAEARTADCDGIAPLAKVAEIKGCSYDTAWAFFRKNKDLKEKWLIFEKKELRYERCRRSAAQFRRENPGKPLHTEELANKLGWTVGALRILLLRNPRLAAELRLAFKPRRRIAKR